MNSTPRQRNGEGSDSPREEMANSLTHGVGVVLSIAALATLMAASLRTGGWERALACTIYGATLLLLYTASTLYHAVAHPPVKRLLRLLDHAAIYLLIAGTYTPFALVTLRDGPGTTLLIAIWGLAALGLVLTSLGSHRFRVASMVLYLGMGWLVVGFIGPVAAALSTPGLVLLIAGGLAYTGGTVFYGWTRLPYNHAVWHLFVLAGSALHFGTVLLDVARA